MFDHNKACRIIRSGHVLEVFFYDKLPKGKGEKLDEGPLLNVYGDEIANSFPAIVYDDFYDQELFGVVFRGIKWIDKAEFPSEWQARDERRAKEYIRSSNHRSREKIRRLALANFDRHDTFMTLTFADNVTDLDYANNELKKFFKRFRYQYGEEVPYLAVIEFQKRGAIHYHCLLGHDFEINYTDSDIRHAKEQEIADIWGHGWVDLQDIRDVDNLGAYLVKYLTKDLGDTRLSGRKHYMLSKGLKHPELIKDTRVMLDSLDGYYPTFSSNFENEFCGHVQYLEYNLLRS